MQGNQVPGANEGGQGALSVSGAMQLAKQSLESVTVRIVGEVSEVSVKAGYKAAYFTVKDKSASLPCMMWNNRYRASGVQLAVGQLVEIAGRFTLYAAKGRMNFDVFSIALAGEGDLRMKVANIAKKLQAEGLTDPARKRQIPVFPERIGLVTSPRSAAVHDVLRTLRRRFPVAEVNLAGVPVEGPNAPAGIIEGLRCVVASGAQVVLVVRGGGSFEDLMPFNDEQLARAIAACPVPVVTGIGHEVDTSIADMVSDLRASTPTAAAEAVSPSAEALTSLFNSRNAALTTSVRMQVDGLSSRLRSIADRSIFQQPQTLFANDAQMLDTSMDRLNRALPAMLERNRAVLDNARTRMIAEGPRLTQRAKHEVATGAGRLNDLSPLATLARGFAVARTSDGEIIRTVDQAPIGSSLAVAVANGRLFCEVKDTDEKSLLDSLER